MVVLYQLNCARVLEQVRGVEGDNHDKYSDYSENMNGYVILCSFTTKSRFVWKAFPANILKIITLYLFTLTFAVKAQNLKAVSLKSRLSNSRPN